MKSAKCYNRNYMPRLRGLTGEPKNRQKQNQRRKKRRIAQIERKLDCAHCPNPDKCRDCVRLKEFTDVYFIRDLDHEDANNKIVR